MRIAEQAFIATDRMNSIKIEHPAETLFQVFVKGKLQYRPSYLIEDGKVVFGFDCLQAGDIVQIFYLLP